MAPNFRLHIYLRSPSIITQIVPTNNNMFCSDRKEDRFATRSILSVTENSY